MGAISAVNWFLFLVKISKVNFITKSQKGVLKPVSVNSRVTSLFV